MSDASSASSPPRRRLSRQRVHRVTAPLDSSSSPSSTASSHRGQALERASHQAPKRPRASPAATTADPEAKAAVDEDLAGDGDHHVARADGHIDSPLLTCHLVRHEAGAPTRFFRAQVIVPDVGGETAIRLMATWGRDGGSAPGRMASEYGDVGAATAAFKSLYTEKTANVWGTSAFTPKAGAYVPASSAVPTAPTPTAVITASNVRTTASNSSHNGSNSRAPTAPAVSDDDAYDTLALRAVPASTSHRRVPDAVAALLARVSAPHDFVRAVMTCGGVPSRLPLGDLRDKLLPEAARLLRKAAALLSSGNATAARACIDHDFARLVPCTAVVPAVSSTARDILVHRTRLINLLDRLDAAAALLRDVQAAMASRGTAASNPVRRPVPPLDALYLRLGGTFLADVTDGEAADLRRLLLLPATHERGGPVTTLELLSAFTVHRPTEAASFAGAGCGRRELLWWTGGQHGSGPGGVAPACVLAALADGISPPLPSLPAEGFSFGRAATFAEAGMDAATAAAATLTPSPGPGGDYSTPVEVVLLLCDVACGRVVTIGRAAEADALIAPLAGYEAVRVESAAPKQEHDGEEGRDGVERGAAEAGGDAVWGHRARGDELLGTTDLERPIVHWTPRHITTLIFDSSQVRIRYAVVVRLTHLPNHCAA